MSQRISKGSLGFAAFLVICIGLLAVIIFTDRRAGLTYTVTFNDAGGLSVGAPVKFRGMQIGEVRSIGFSDSSSNEIAVDLRIYPPYRDRIHAPPNTTARIKSDSIVMGRSYVEVINRGAPGTTIESGAVVKGSDGWVDEAMFAGGGTVATGARRALEFGRSTFDSLDDWARGERGADMRESVTGFLDSVRDSASSGTETAREKLSDSIARGRELIGQLREEKAPELAEDLKSSLEALVRESTELSEEAKTRLMAEIDALRAESGAEAAPAATPTPAPTPGPGAGDAPADS